MAPAPNPSRIVVWGFAALLVALVPFPPETRPLSAPGIAALVAFLFLLVARRIPSGSHAALVGLGAGGWALYRFATASGASVEPLAALVLAAGLAAAGAAVGEDPRSRKAVVTALLLGACLAALHGLYQLAFGFEAAVPWARAAPLAQQERVLARLAERRAFGPFATPAALAGYLALVLPLTAVSAARTAGRWRGALWGALALQSAGLLAARSWTAPAALLLVLLVARRIPRSMRGLLVVGGGLLVAGVTFLRPALLDVHRADHPLALRLGNARVAVTMIAAHPWRGVGLGGFGENFPAFRRASDNEARHAHNLPLEALAELGVPLGVVAALGFYAAFLGPALRPRNGDPTTRALAVGLGAFALHNLVDFTAFFPSLVWTAAFVRGWMAGGERALGPERRERAGAAAAAVVVAAAGIVALGGLAAEARYEAARTLAADPARAQAQASRAAKLAPWHPDGWLLCAESRSRTAQGEGDWSEALACADRAVAASPVRPAARALRARIRLRLGDRAGALADLERAASLYPIQAEYASQRDRLRDWLQSGERSRP